MEVCSNPQSSFGTTLNFFLTLNLYSDVLWVDEFSHRSNMLLFQLILVLLLPFFFVFSVGSKGPPLLKQFLD